MHPYRKAAFEQRPALVLPPPFTITSLWPLLLFSAVAIAMDVAFVFPEISFSAVRVGDDVKCHVVRDSLLRHDDRVVALQRPTRAFTEVRAGRPPSVRLLADTATGPALVLAKSRPAELTALQRAIASPEESAPGVEAAVVHSGSRFAVLLGFLGIFVVPVAGMLGMRSLRPQTRLWIEEDASTGVIQMSVREAGATSWSSGPLPRSAFRAVRFEDRPGAVFKALALDFAGAPPLDIPIRLGSVSAHAIERFVRKGG